MSKKDNEEQVFGLAPRLSLVIYFSRGEVTAVSVQTRVTVVFPRQKGKSIPRFTLALEFKGTPCFASLPRV